MEMRDDSWSLTVHFIDLRFDCCNSHFNNIFRYKVNSYIFLSGDDCGSSTCMLLFAVYHIETTTPSYYLTIFLASNSKSISNQNIGRTSWRVIGRYRTILCRLSWRKNDFANYYNELLVNFIFLFNVHSKSARDILTKMNWEALRQPLCCPNLILSECHNVGLFKMILAKFVLVARRWKVPKV